MSKHDKCSKCQGTQIVKEVSVVDRTLEEDWMVAPDLNVEVITKPNARLLKGVVGIPLKATVCGSCGHTELYVSDLGKLLEAVERRAQNGK